MEKLRQKMMALWQDEEGATMVEYGIMVALIAVICIATIGILGTTIDGFFQEVNETLENGG